MSFVSISTTPNTHTQLFDVGCQYVTSSYTLTRFFSNQLLYVVVKQLVFLPGKQCLLQSEHINDGRLSSMSHLFVDRHTQVEQT